MNETNEEGIFEVMGRGELHLSVLIETMRREGHKALVHTAAASNLGQMLPLPMNEYLQQALAECYFDVQLDVIEWNTLFTNWRRGTKDPSANGSNAINVTYAAMDPFFALVRFLQSGMAPPVLGGASDFEQAARVSVALTSTASSRGFAKRRGRALGLGMSGSGGSVDRVRLAGHLIS